MKSAQEFIHWLEIGAGSRWLQRGGVLLLALSLSLLLCWKQFRGPQAEATLLQADVGRQLARGEGFTTQVRFPQSLAVLQSHGQRFAAQEACPELHHPPLYPLVIAASLKVLPPGLREKLFESAPGASRVAYGGDLLLLALNLLLFFFVVWLTFLLGRSLFDARAASLAALGVLLSWPLWEGILAVNGTALLAALGLALFLLWAKLDRALTSPVSLPLSRLMLGSAGLGGLSGLLFLSTYPAGAVLPVLLAHVGSVARGRMRWLLLGSVATGFVLVATPWLLRNVAVVGHPLALASHDVALKAGDPTAEPAVVRATVSAAAPALSLRKVANKALTALQTAFGVQLWSGGALVFTAFFLAGFLYPFRSPTTNRLRWLMVATIATLLLSQAVFSSGESDRLVATWIAPLMIVCGAGFFFVLLASHPRWGQWPRLAAGVLLALHAVPLVQESLAPAPSVRFHYPPYFPSLLRGLRTELENRQLAGSHGIMADIPAGVAWYADAPVWAQPAALRDFHAVTLEQPIAELLLTPRTLDRPFFSELNPRGPRGAALDGSPASLGEWGEVYAGLVSGTFPRTFPLRAAHRVAENLYVLLDPALPQPRGK